MAFAAVGMLEGLEASRKWHGSSIRHEARWIRSAPRYGLRRTGGRPGHLVIEAIERSGHTHEVMRASTAAGEMCSGCQGYGCGRSYVARGQPATYRSLTAVLRQLVG